MADDKYRLNLVMPADLHKRLLALAQGEKRTLTNFIVVELEKLADAAEKANG